MAARDCPGREAARRAASLVDLLFETSAPPEAPLLLRRRPEGGWCALSRREVRARVLRLAAWLAERGVRPGDRVGLLGPNGVPWFLADFAILRLGAVTVPAYCSDPAQTVCHVIRDAGCRIVLAEPGEQMAKLNGLTDGVPLLPLWGGEESAETVAGDPHAADEVDLPPPGRGDLATLIYTSGTTGDPKGVMLTHGNLLADVEACLGGVPVHETDRFLSFLPVSHAFERTVGHFLPVACGATIAYAEDVRTVLRDAGEVQPTIVISVPRLYEKIYAGVHEKLLHVGRAGEALFSLAQRLGTAHRAAAERGDRLPPARRLAWRLVDLLVHAPLRRRLGGRLRLFISGGAALSPEIARFLLAADVTILPGYGLTEAGPVLTVNTEREIRPETVGPPLPGVELRIGEGDELLARGPMIMNGYWHRPEESAAAIDGEGWLHTGDLARIDGDGFVHISGRRKEMIVLDNGENVPPVLVERHLMQDPCVRQAMVVGEGRSFLAALVVPDRERLARVWRRATGAPLPEGWRDDAGVRDWLLARLARTTRDLAGFMQVRRIFLVAEPWSQEAGLLTPTQKFKRHRIEARHAGEIEALFER